MTERILVVEHEGSEGAALDAALRGLGYEVSIVPEGEQMLRALEGERPKLIIVSSADLIGLIRARGSLQHTPILLIMSGYHGKTPKEEAVRLGATDMLPKPFAEVDLLTKVEQMVARRTISGRYAPIKATGSLTSNEIFGDIVAENQPAQPKKIRNTSADLDALLERTLSDVLPKPKPRQPSGTFEKKLQDTLSGLEKSARAATGRPVSVESPIPARADKIHQSHPVFQVPPPTPTSPPVEEEEPADGVKFGQYVLLEKIATGGMAEVWKARMRGVQGFQKIVAIKKILPHLSDNQEFIEMFIDEAKLAAQLTHNNIIHIYDLGHVQNAYYIAMEFVDGHDLKTILKRAADRDQPLGEELALFTASKIAAALDYAHRKRDFEGQEMGLVHRDVSPQNVLISREGDIKLCDFGIAKAATKASHTQAGALKGKLQYMSPEQAWGQSIDRRSDIFALGAVLFEMLTRRKLFVGEHEMSILEQVREARIMPPSQLSDEVSPEIDAVVMKALQKDPASRYQTAAEMAKDLESLLYAYRPTPTSADLAIYMHRLDEAQPVAREEAPPSLDEPRSVPPPPAPPQQAAPQPARPAAPRTMRTPAPLTLTIPKKRSPAIAIAAALVIAAAAIGGFFFIRGKSTSASAAAVPKTSTVVAPPPASAAVSATVATAATETLAPSPVVATTTEALIDPTKVNEEVQRRLAAERARLEQQRARIQQSPAQSQPVVPAPTPQPAPPPVVTESAPPAVVSASQPAPEPAAAAPAAAQPPAVKEGDFVDDLEGLVPARMIRRATVSYPPLARMQRVEGTVLVGALVSETGAVLETRVIKPIDRPVGLNEAAVQIVRRSTFSPPTKNGVRVKAWTTVPIDFKL